MTSSRAIFAESGPFTAMPNALYDWVQPRLSLSAWSVLCVIVRRTRGWGKRYDAISYEQIKAATGIKSTATIAKALNELLCDSLFGKPILRRQKSRERTASCREATRYALNPRFEILIEDEGQKPSLDGRSQRAENGEDSPRGHGDTEVLEMERGSGGERNAAECALDFEGDGVGGALDFEGPVEFRASENEDTKETLISDKVKNSGCEHARASPPASPPFSSSSVSDTPSLLAVVSAATRRDVAVVSARMRGQLIACARTLERAGYRREDIELVAERWPYPTAPTPTQLLDHIQALLCARPTPLPLHAKPSNPATAPRASGRDDSAKRHTAAPPARFECAAARKSRKWADWLADLGDA